MVQLQFIPRSEFERVAASALPSMPKLELLADMLRVNILTVVKRAGSGHLGTSLSSADILAMLYYHELNIAKVGVDSPDRDIFFSSKGHDAPALYAVLYALGILSEDKFINLRRFGGAEGHPMVSTPGIEANTGSLGMGISKGKGFALAKKLRHLGGRVVVLTGDGELQEGQVWESLQTTVHQRLTNVVAIVDHNKVQSDKLVEQTLSLGAIKEKFAAFGWHVERCDGNSMPALNLALERVRTVESKPKVIIADTLKGAGVSFMEHPAALQAAGGYYRWHSGAPDDASYTRAVEEVTARLHNRCLAASLEPITVKLLEPHPPLPAAKAQEIIADAYGDTLAELGETRRDIVVLDADLATDCRLRKFEARFPERFVENGIAEQDMVSMAGGLALAGFLPVVNSFGCFLAPRANEQIFTNASEGTKVIYVCHFAGLIPAGPGFSHQSLRDASLFTNIPGVTVLEPCNSQETEMVVRYAMEKAPGTCMIRLLIGPSPSIVNLPSGYELVEGRGAVLSSGRDAMIFSYGPIMCNQAILAAELLQQKGMSVGVVAMPWLNRLDTKWFQSAMGESSHAVVMENHFPQGALSDSIRQSLSAANLSTRYQVTTFAVDRIPACGTAPEVLAFHQLDATSVASRIQGLLKL